VITSLAGFDSPTVCDGRICREESVITPLAGFQVIFTGRSWVIPEAPGRSGRAVHRRRR
jgi:hypothetical protein